MIGPAGRARGMYRLRTVGGREGERVDDLVATHDALLGDDAV